VIIVKTIISNIIPTHRLFQIEKEGFKGNLGFLYLKDITARVERSGSLLKGYISAARAHSTQSIIGDINISSGCERQWRGISVQSANTYLDGASAGYDRGCVAVSTNEFFLFENGIARSGINGFRIHSSTGCEIRGTVGGAILLWHGFN